MTCERPDALCRPPERIGTIDPVPGLSAAYAERLAAYRPPALEQKLLRTQPMRGGWADLSRRGVGHQEERADNRSAEHEDAAARRRTRPHPHHRDDGRLCGSRSAGRAVGRHGCVGGPRRHATRTMSSPHPRCLTAGPGYYKQSAGRGSHTPQGGDRISAIADEGSREVSRSGLQERRPTSRTNPHRACVAREVAIVVRLAVLPPHGTALTECSLCGVHARSRRFDLQRVTASNPHGTTSGHELRDERHSFCRIERRIGGPPKSATDDEVPAVGCVWVTGHRSHREQFASRPAAEGVRSRNLLSRRSTRKGLKPLRLGTRLRGDLLVPQPMGVEDAAPPSRRASPLPATRRRTRVRPVGPSAPAIDTEVRWKPPVTIRDPGISASYRLERVARQGERVGPAVLQHCDGFRHGWRGDGAA